MQKKPVVEVDPNIHHIAGEDLLKKKDGRFIEYRRKWKEWPEKFYIGEFPLFIDIEVSSVCNLNCPFCFTGFLSKKIDKGFVSFDIVKKIIDEGRDNGLYGVKFNIRGEPLLNHRIHKFVQYAKEKRLVDVYFNTNGMLLTRTMSRKLIDAGLDRITISFEGYTKDVYERYRVGANYETVLSNIEYLQLLKKKLGVQHPKIRVQPVTLPELKSTFEDYKEFWKSRVDEVSFLDYQETTQKRKGIRYPWACPQLWQRMAIWWDGTIFACNHDLEGLLPLGNVHKTSIKEAWSSKKANRIRSFHKKGMAHAIPACDGCYIRTSQIHRLRSRGARL